MHTHDGIQMFKNTTSKVQRMADTSRLHERQHIHEEDDTFSYFQGYWLLPPSRL